MNKKVRNSLIAFAGSLAIGAVLIIPVVTSDNGYVAGFVFFPLLLLIGLVSLLAFVVGVGLTIADKSAGPILAFCALLLPLGFFGAAAVSKQFEIGAYREEPMRPIIPPISNKVIFNKDATHDEVQSFWTDVVGYRTGESGHWSRPGVQSVGSAPDEDGHQVVLFSFTENVTEEQKADIRRRIESYPPVLQYLENVETTSAPDRPALPNGDDQSSSEKKKALKVKEAAP